MTRVGEGGRIKRQITTTETIIISGSSGRVPFKKVPKSLEVLKVVKVLKVLKVKKVLEEVTSLQSVFSGRDTPYLSGPCSPLSSSFLPGSLTISKGTTKWSL